MSPSQPENPDQPNDDTGEAAKAAAILGAGFALVALGFYGTRTATSVLVGATIAVANLLTMRAIIRALLPPPEEDKADGEDGGTGQLPRDDRNDRNDHKKKGNWGGVAWGLFAGFKILILFGGVWILLTQKLVDPMPLTVGYGVLPLGIAARALWSSLRGRQ
jgi:hypothetical protein